jgi:cytochrome c oxidase subunit 2
MNRIRAALLGMLTTALLGVATQPALAQLSDSDTESLIWDLNLELLAIAIPITILVEAILIYTVWRYRESNVEEAKPTKENRRLEITWTIATAVVLLFVGVGAYTVLAQSAVSAPDEPEVETMNVQVDGERYFWKFYYPEQNVSANSNQGELVLPKDTTVRINVSSNDWLHAFHVPELALKADAFPGRSNYLQTTLNNEGKYQLYCAEYCGSGHSQMLGTVNVTDQETFEAWIDQKQSEE